MVSDLFKLSDLPDGRWSVSWHERGPVTKKASKKLIADTAFQSGSFQVSLAASNEKILTIDCIAFCDEGFKTSVMIDLLPDVVGVRFDKLSHAEKFIDLMEKHIMWRVLARQI